MPDSVPFVRAPTPPLSPQYGDEWQNTRTGKVFVWTLQASGQGAWVQKIPAPRPTAMSVSLLESPLDGIVTPTVDVTRVPNITISATPPPGALLGDLWWSPHTGMQSIWFNDGNTIQWVQTQPVKYINIAALSGPAGGDLTGDYPNPTIIPGVALNAPLLEANPPASDNSLLIASTSWVNSRIPAVGGGFFLPLTGGALTGNLSAPNYVIDNVVNTARQLLYRTTGATPNRWNVYTGGGAESGSNVGSDFFIGRYSDAGTIIDNPLSINRASGVITMPNRVGIGGVTPAVPGTSWLWMNGDITFNSGNHALMGNMYYDAGWKYTAGGFTGAFEKFAESTTIAYSLAVAPNNTGGAGAAATPVTVMTVSAGGLINFTSTPTFTTGGFLPLAGGTLTGTVSTTKADGNPAFAFHGASGTARYTRYHTSGLARWDIGVSSAAESGSNVGSDFYLSRVLDDGTTFATALSIIRGTGVVVAYGQIQANVGNKGAADFDAVYFQGQTSAAISSVTANTSTATTATVRSVITMPGIANAYGLWGIAANSGNPYAFMNFGAGITAGYYQQVVSGSFFWQVNGVTQATLNTGGLTLIPSILSVSPPSVGKVKLVGGTASNSGYVSFHQTNDTRVGYIGFFNTGIGYVAELAGGFHNFYGPGSVNWAGLGGASNTASLTIYNGSVGDSALWQIDSTGATYFRGQKAGQRTYLGTAGANIVQLISSGFYPATNNNLTLGDSNTYWSDMWAGAGHITGAAGTGRNFIFSTGATSRWIIGADPAAESGSNAGSNFNIYACNDAGTPAINTLTINRANGVVNFSTTPTVGGVPIGGGASITVGTSPPGSPSQGALWWHSDLGQMFVYYNDGNTSQWVPASPSLSTDGVMRLYSEQVLTSIANEMRVSIPATAKKIEIEFWFQNSPYADNAFFIHHLGAGGAIIGTATYNYARSYLHATNQVVADSIASATGLNYGGLSQAWGRIHVTITPVLGANGNVVGNGFTAGSVKYAMHHEFDCSHSGITGFRIAPAAGNMVVGSYMRCYVVT